LRKSIVHCSICSICELVSLSAKPFHIYQLIVPDVVEINDARCFFVTKALIESARLPVRLL
jgi:hypothetical protein